MAPITSAIRRQMTDEGARVTADRDEFLAVCDAVDSIHARKLRALDASTRRVDELEALRNENRALQSSLLPPMSVMGQDVLDSGGFWRFVKQDDGTLGLLWDDSIGNVLEEHGWVRKDEYDELRELVRIMHSELVSCEDNGYICGGHKFDKRVSELGIEVSDG